jgi:hypothetical protein
MISLTETDGLMLKCKSLPQLKLLCLITEMNQSLVFVGTSMSEKRTSQQQKALELWCKILAEDLNAAGLDQRKVLKPSIAIPWNQPDVKNKIFRPVFTAMTGLESTADADPSDYNPVYEVLCRHLAMRLGVTAPAWPDRNREDLRDVM